MCEPATLLVWATVFIPLFLYFPPLVSSMSHLDPSISWPLVPSLNNTMLFPCIPYLSCTLMDQPAPSPKSSGAGFQDGCHPWLGDGGAETFLGQPPLPLSQEFVFPHLPSGFGSPGLVGMDLGWTDGSGNSQAEGARGVFYRIPKQFVI